MYGVPYGSISVAFGLVDMGLGTCKHWVGTSMRGGG
jgi:hypothetical protein